MLQNLMRKMKRDNKGFTLVELMIVVVIIGILIAIAIPIYNSIQATAEKRACQANLRSIKSQLEVWKADDAAGAGDGDYPSDAEFPAAFMLYAFENDTPICPQDDTPVGYTYVYVAATGASGATYTLACPVNALHIL